MSETYVHGDIEVKRTGRVAHKVVGKGGSSPPVELVEITPVNDYDGTWKKWVNPSSLFRVVEPGAS